MPLVPEQALQLQVYQCCQSIHYQVSSTLNYWPVPKGTVRFCSPHNILELPKDEVEGNIKTPGKTKQPVTSNLVVSYIHVAGGFRQENLSHLCSVGEQVTID